MEKPIGRARPLSDHYKPQRRAPAQIRLVPGGDELEEIYRLRYRIYVREMNLPQSYANHVAESVEDPLDCGGYNFGAFIGEEVVGALRVNFPRSSDIGFYNSFLDMASVGFFHPSATSICTRLMVLPHLRGTTLAMRLAMASYEFGLQNGIRFNFLDCDDSLVRFFERLGYANHRRAEHPEYGVGTVMRLDLLDRAGLARARSPFLAILERRASHKDAALPRPASRAAAFEYATA